ncbi:DUF4097 family beta strand repeat-containing protein [Amycolatopsis cihanbeyliensis]|uniref:Putative adhesin n=1 Tax=Amycolatopsis cihanbeyliensis TaxID=1128664 RepID=A0A542DKN8_AMYCI|nr:DUF4097 family beta strand repeat-containing protein [Amycolatopsis cihanbeyliensis]TQJ03656.1 putative adhesin [Amycolatopsis cihanbeyliensis]
MARPGLALGGIVMIGAGVAVAFGWVWPSTAEATGTVAERVRSVEIDNSSGDITITVADVRETTVRQNFSYRFGQPDDTFSSTGGELYLGDCGWWCSVDYEVVLPRAAAVTGDLSSGTLTLEGVASADVRGSSGDMRVRDVDGSVRLEISSGDVELTDVGQDVTVDASSGNIIGRDLRGDVTAEANSGDITLGLSVAGDVRADASSGNIEVTVPDGDYRVEGESNSGDRRIQVGQSTSAAHLLRLDTSSGDVTVNAG